MKKTLILSVVAVAATISSPSYAASSDAAACSGATAGGSYAFPTSNFVKTAFNVKCSNNVYSHWADSDTAIGVVAGSAKGKNYFGGGTQGGGISVVTTCATTGCSTTEIKQSTAVDKRDAS